jgi:uncharacterized membrane protein
MLIKNMRRLLMSALWFMVILAASRILVTALIGGIAGAERGAIEGYEAGRAASAAFSSEHGWGFLPLAMIVSAVFVSCLTPRPHQQRRVTK